MPRLNGNGKLEYLPLGTTRRNDNQNKRERPYCCYLAIAALVLASAALGCILGSVYCDSVTGGLTW